MKLATIRTADRDGTLVVLDRAGLRMISARGVAPSLRSALEQWSTVEPALRALSEQIEQDPDKSEPWNPKAADAPLPRAWQWLDASAFPSHGILMQKAFDLPPVETDRPLMYQGMSHQFLAAHDDVRFSSEADGIDFEAELGIVVDDVPMGISADDARQHIKLAVLINDWSLRAIAPLEMKTGFGWIGAKPACSMAPIAITLDELGRSWRDDGRVDVEMLVHRNDDQFGKVRSTEMEFGFHELVAHAARTRDLCAGTIIGSGTVSSADSRRAGSCCIAERRAIEMIDKGQPGTAFLHFGERVSITALTEGKDRPWGTIEQRVIANR